VNVNFLQLCLMKRVFLFLGSWKPPSHDAHDGLACGFVFIKAHSSWLLGLSLRNGLRRAGIKFLTWTPHTFACTRRTSRSRSTVRVKYVYKCLAWFLRDLDMCKSTCGTTHTQAWEHAAFAISISITHTHTHTHTHTQTWYSFTCVYHR
jgi:hypothetical protein